MQLSLWAFGGTGKVSGDLGGQKRDLNGTPQPLVLSGESWRSLWVEILLWTNCLQTVCGSSAGSLTEAVVASVSNRNQKVFSFASALNYFVSKLLLLFYCAVGHGNKQYFIAEIFWLFWNVPFSPKGPFQTNLFPDRRLLFHPPFTDHLAVVPKLCDHRLKAIDLQQSPHFKSATDILLAKIQRYLSKLLKMQWCKLTTMAEACWDPWRLAVVACPCPSLSHCLVIIISSSGWDKMAMSR